MAEPRIVRPGDSLDLELPYSEVCMHMRLAGKTRRVELVKHEPTSASGHATFSARIYLPEGGHTSVLPAEAGILFGAGAFWAEACRISRSRETSANV